MPYEVSAWKTATRCIILMGITKSCSHRAAKGTNSLGVVPDTRDTTTLPCHCSEWQKYQNSVNTTGGRSLPLLRRDLGWHTGWHNHFWCSKEEQAIKQRQCIQAAAAAFDTPPFKIFSFQLSSFQFSKIYHFIKQHSLSGEKKILIL